MKRIAAFIVGIFFRRSAVTGAEQVPRTGPLLFVLNHPNALIDPLFLLAFSPRPVAFLAKAPLFRMPVVGWLVRRAGSIPVYRRQDDADMSRNRATFEQVYDALHCGGAIALFPEGTSHSESHMRPFKTGAARMALGASAASTAPVRVVPAGLYYTAKARFRSSALLCFGEPIEVEATPLAADGEPDPAAVRDLTARLESALSQVTLQADHDEALRLITRAERILSSADPANLSPSDLAVQFAVRQRFLDGYARLRVDAPADLAALQRRIERFDAALALVKLAPESVPSGADAPSEIATVFGRLAALAPLAPIALVGIVIHWPAYRIIGPLVTRGFQVERDVVATGKVLAAALLFPLTWIVVGTVAGMRLGVLAGLAAGLVAPACGFAALRFLELLDRSAGALRAVGLRFARPRTFRRLEDERRKIRETIMALGERVSG